MDKMCSMCGQVKDVNQFRFRKDWNKYYNYCKDCERIYNREYQRIYRERKKKRNKEAN